MARQAHLNPGPFYLEGDRAKGALLVHGFTGSPPEMRRIGDYLHERGYTVSGPLLPGHGTSVEDMNRRSWHEWTAHVEFAYVDLRDRCDRVVVGGLSMGTLLSINLAAAHREVAALALYAPAAKIDNRLIYLSPVLKHLIPVWRKSGESDLAAPGAERSVWSYAAYPTGAAHELLKLIYRVRSLLPHVTAPVLIFHAARDKHVREDGAQYVFDRIGSRSKQLVVLAQSGHALTVDKEWETVARQTYAFFEEQIR